MTGLPEPPAEGRGARARTEQLWTPREYPADTWPEDYAPVLDPLWEPAPARPVGPLYPDAADTTVAAINRAAARLADRLDAEERLRAQTLEGVVT